MERSNRIAGGWGGGGRGAEGGHKGNYMCFSLPAVPSSFLSTSETQQDLASQVGTGGPVLPRLWQTLEKSLLILPFSVSFHWRKTTLCSRASWILISQGHSHAPCCLRNLCCGTTKVLLFFNPFIYSTNVYWVLLCARHHVTGIND